MKTSSLAAALSIGLLLQLPPVIADPMADGDIPVNLCDSFRLPGRCIPAPLSAEDNMREAKIEQKGIEITRKLTLGPQPVHANPSACEARFEIQYFQADDRIKVDTEVTNETCQASRGEFSLRIRTVDPSGAVATRSFPESWLRHGTGTVQMTKYYPMGGGQNLVWVRIDSSRKTGCTCD